MVHFLDILWIWLPRGMNLGAKLLSPETIFIEFDFSFQSMTNKISPEKFFLEKKTLKMTSKSSLRSRPLSLVTSFLPCACRFLIAPYLCSRWFRKLTGSVGKGLWPWGEKPRGAQRGAERERGKDFEVNFQGHFLNFFISMT